MDSDLDFALTLTLTFTGFSGTRLLFAILVGNGEAFVATSPLPLNMLLVNRLVRK